MTKQLNEDGRQQVALALILLKDFKSQGRFDPDLTLMIIEMADHLGVRSEYDDLTSKIPPMKIEPRYK